MLIRYVEEKRKNEILLGLEWGAAGRRLLLRVVGQVALGPRRDDREWSALVRPDELLGSGHRLIHPSTVPSLGHTKRTARTAHSQIPHPLYSIHRSQNLGYIKTNKHLLSGPSTCMHVHCL